jgi:uracil-DNA glycosylase family 4
MEVLTPTIERIVTTRRTVPNEQPIQEPSLYRIAVIGEAPGEEEENHHRPFVGKSGQFLTNVMRDVGIDRPTCLMGNICQVRPPANRIEAFRWEGEEIQEGLAKLNEDIRRFNPNICVLLGGTPLRAALGDKHKITDWRGSLFKCDDITSPFYGRKCIAALHPAFVLREFSGYPLLKFDLKRARDEGTTPTLNLPTRELILNYDAGTLCYIMDTWPSGQRCSLDIEGGLGGWPCVSLSARPTKGFVIAWRKFDEAAHGRILQAFARLMARRDVPKVLQNSLYDNFVLSYGFGILIRNVAEDTMLKGWEIYSELPKALGVQASIWTREPYYKFERKSDDSDILYRYCAKDSTVTLEICQNQDNVLEGSGLTHYHKNVEMLNPLLYMELRGIKYDTKNVEQKLKETHEEIQKVGEALNQIAGTELRGTKGSLSAKRLASALYDKLGYPKQYKKLQYGSLKQAAGVKTLTTDIEALLTLRKRQPNDRFLDGVLKHRHLEGLIETLSIKCDPDGRVRCGYNVVGTETGRLTCYTSPTGAGANLQTITKKLRDNYIADDEYEMFQCDLAGADGWTVAAHCARLGDPTMLDDLRSGIKIAKVIVLLYQLGVDINKLDRDSLANAIRVVDPDAWEYFACKRVQHATNYLVGVPTLCAQVMKDSFKLSGEPIYLEHAQGRAFQDLYKSRYRGLELYHSWAHSKLLADGLLTSASGHTRVFFGRRFGTGIHETIKEFLADEPQQNTTWATNLAMLALWNDPENRRPDGSLIIEPLHQVHDALIGQWPVAARDWAKRKVQKYFNNVLKIAGIDICIPFEGRYGRSWGELTNEL